MAVLEDKAVLVTGAGAEAEIGRTIALMTAANGASLAAADIDRAATAAWCRAEPRRRGCA